jgi:hypothetical protein
MSIDKDDYLKKECACKGGFFKILAGAQTPVK